MLKMFGLVVHDHHLQVLRQGNKTNFSDKGEKCTESKTEKRNVCLIEKVNNTRGSPEAVCVGMRMRSWMCAEISHVFVTACSHWVNFVDVRFLHPFKGSLDVESQCFYIHVWPGFSGHDVLGLGIGGIILKRVIAQCRADGPPTCMWYVCVATFVL